MKARAKLVHGRFGYLFLFFFLFLLFSILTCSAGCNGDDPGRNGDGGFLSDGGVKPPACDLVEWPYSGCPPGKVCENGSCGKDFRASIEFRFPKVDGVQLTGSINLRIAACIHFNEGGGSCSFWESPEYVKNFTTPVGETHRVNLTMAGALQITGIGGDAAKYVFAKKEAVEEREDWWGYRIHRPETDLKIDWNGEAEYGIKVDGIYRIEETGRSERVTSDPCTKDGLPKTCLDGFLLSNRTAHEVFPEGATMDGEVSKDATQIWKRLVAGDGEILYDYHYTFLSSGSGD